MYKEKDKIIAIIKSPSRRMNKKYLVIYPDDSQGTNGDIRKELILGDKEYFIPLLCKNGFSRVMLSGPTGCGKSTLIRNLLKKIIA